MSRIRDFFRNKWTKFAIWGGLYTLVFVVWTGNLWWLVGLPILFDIFITKWFYRSFGYKHTELRKRSKLYNDVMGWVDPILFAVVAAMILRTFFFENYTIPTPSMEKSMLVGDYLTVSKVAYGPKMPNTPISFPLVHNTMPFSPTKKSFVEWIRRPYHRLKGLGSVERNDVVVFNFPEGDTVFLNENSNFYYDIVRQLGWAQAQRMGRTDTRPVDKRENYVKRCVALPGDSLQVVHGQVYVNGRPQEAFPGMQYNYTVRTDGTGRKPNDPEIEAFIAEMKYRKPDPGPRPNRPENHPEYQVWAQRMNELKNFKLNIFSIMHLGLSPDDLREMNLSLSDFGMIGNGVYHLPLTAENAAKIEAFGNVVSVVRDEALDPLPQVYFPHDERYPWTQDNFGPIWIPKKGVAVPLTVDNLPLYRRIITTYEGHTLEVQGETILVDGVPAANYTFAMDYYWMMGDNRHNSADSRFWGFVPEDHVVGKSSYVWLSLDRERRFPANIRWNRIFTRIR
jgi:signal peptidase I